tara:strand:- start:10126 stop:10374 length:249 start_codon:yes stop_codon:yes gene_type:complete
MNLTYADASNGINEIISSLGFKLFMGEAEVKPTVKAVRAKVSSYYASLNRENRLDVLHAYDAENKSELIENAILDLMERIEG